MKNKKLTAKEAEEIMLEQGREKDYDAKAEAAEERAIEDRTVQYD